MWRFNTLLLRVLGEISLSFLCSHSSWGSALDLAPPLHVGCLRATLPHPESLNEQLSSGLSLTQARGREGYQLCSKPAVAEAGMTLQQAAVCHVFSQGNCPCITGPWQWRAAQAPWRGGADSDLCLHTGFLVSVAAAFAFHARLWVCTDNCSSRPSLELV